ncbi:hypothetical protein HN011_003609 [Eciton burchellii]|nr:hypothetical protein HN011_003609 [Eciton burchellii]
MSSKGIRVLPDIPIDIPHLENLIREFEKSLTSISEDRKNVVSPSPSSGRIVKEIVKAYELRALENAQQKKQRRKSGLVDSPQSVRRRRMSDGLIPTACYRYADNLQEQDSLSKDSGVFSVLDTDNKAHDVIDLAVTSQYHSNAEKSIPLKVWPKASPINIYDEDEITTIASSSPKKGKRWNLNKKGRLFRSPAKDKQNTDKSKINMYYSDSSLEENKDEDRVLRDILTNSSSDSTGYKNLQIDMYDFEESEYHPAFTTLEKSSIFYDDVASSDTSDDSSPLDSSFESTSEDAVEDTQDSENYESATESATLNRDQKPRVIGALLKRPMKINSPNVTRIPTLKSKLPQKNSLKKMVSMFTSKRKKIATRSKTKSSKQWHACLEGEQTSSSCSLQKCSKLDTTINSPFESPTFETFGYTNSPTPRHVNEMDKKRIVFVDVPREDLTKNHRSSKAMSGDYLSFLKQAILRNAKINSPSEDTSSAESESSYEHLSPLEHPHLATSQNKVLKHLCVAHTKTHRMNEETTTRIKQEKKTEEKSNMSESESSVMLSTSASISMSTSLNISSPKLWMASSPNNTYNKPKQ